MIRSALTIITPWELLIITIIIIIISIFIIIFVVFIIIPTSSLLQFRSTKCPYALDVDVSTLSGTLYIEKTVNWPLMGMCGDCDDQWNGYVLANGTSVDDVTDEQVSV